jgi:hypothetical protein
MQFSPNDYIQIHESQRAALLRTQDAKTPHMCSALDNRLVQSIIEAWDNLAIELTARFSGALLLLEHENNFHKAAENLGNEITGIETAPQPSNTVLTYINVYTSDEALLSVTLDKRVKTPMPSQGNNPDHLDWQPCAYACFEKKENTWQLNNCLGRLEDINNTICDATSHIFAQYKQDGFGKILRTRKQRKAYDKNGHLRLTCF